MSAEGKVSYFDLTEQFSSLKSRWFDEIEQLGTVGNFILGNAISDIELKLADFLGVKHAITVSSGTDALVLALRAVGVGPGDSVILPDFTFFATAEPISLVGARPIFVDIHPSDFNIDAAQIEAAIDCDTKAIIPVHLFGLPAKIEDICEIGKRHGIAVVEDVAQAFGSKVGERCTGGIGDVGCFSFYPTKILGAFGDGGMITTNSDSLAERLKLLRNHGATGSNNHELIGCTSRLNTVQASILKIKLESVQSKIMRRQQIAEEYKQRLQGLDIEFQIQQPGITHVYNIFTIRSSVRDEIARAFTLNEIGYQIYYPKPIHMQTPYMNSSYADEHFSESVKASKEVISLPLYPEMPPSHIERICKAVRDVLG